MKRTLSICAAAIVIATVLCSCKPSNDLSEIEQLIKSGEPTVTSVIDSVSMNSVSLNGFASYYYIMLGDEAGFIISTSENPTMDNHELLIRATQVDDTGNFRVLVSGLKHSTKYYYRTYLRRVSKTILGNVKSFETKSFDIGKMEAVDLGLSVKWANINIGAETSGDYGSLYPLDEVKTVMSSDWRCPTPEELSELIDTKENSDYQWEWKSVDGHNGWQIMNSTTGNSIFLPATGYQENTYFNFVGTRGLYWSLPQNKRDSDKVWCLILSSDFVGMSSDDIRWAFYMRSFTVRPVTE